VTAVPAAAVAFAVPTIIKRSASAQGQTTVRLTGWSSSPEEDKLLGQVIDSYQQSQSAVKVDYQLVTGDYAAKLQTDIAAGTVADVFYVDSLPAQDLMSRGALMPLDDKMAASGVKAEDFYPGLIKAFQFQNTTYGLPKDWSSLAMVYDQDALSAAGVTTPPTDWDSLKAAAQALKDKAGEARLMMDPDPARYLAFHYAAGATVISADGTEVQIDTPEAKTALDFYAGLYKDGLSTTHADAGAEWPGDGLSKDLADLVFEGNWVFPFLKTNAPNLKFGISPMPKGPATNATLAFTVSYSIFATNQGRRRRVGPGQLLDGPRRYGEMDLPWPRDAVTARTGRCVAQAVPRAETVPGRRRLRPRMGLWPRRSAVVHGRAGGHGKPFRGEGRHH